MMWLMIYRSVKLGHQMRAITILVPTYDERDNIRDLIERLLLAMARVKTQIIVIDDNSPDGTADVVRQEFNSDERVTLLERPNKMGLGSAILDGLKTSQGDYIVMMDADLSHRPEDVPRLIQKADMADIVVGSRYIKGASIKGWSWFRKLASRMAILLAKSLVRFPVDDPTSGFAVFNRRVLDRLSGQLNPKGFKILTEILVKSPGAVVNEVPITFSDRESGKSKFSFREILVFLRLCIHLRSYQRRDNVGRQRWNSK